MSESDLKREKIIDAARERFSHYGYPKTTIAELADDCAMSPGNIYRFFKGKIDIAVEIARREALSAVEVIEAVLECPVRSSRQRLSNRLILSRPLLQYFACWSIVKLSCTLFGWHVIDIHHNNCFRRDVGTNAIIALGGTVHLMVVGNLKMALVVGLSVLVFGDVLTAALSALLPSVCRPMTTMAETRVGASKLAAGPSLSPRPGSSCNSGMMMAAGAGHARSPPWIYTG